MNLLLRSLQPAVRRRPRYSVRPFYITLLVFAILAAGSLIVGNLGKGFVQAPYVQQLTTAGGSLLKREDEPECRMVRNVKYQCAFVRANCPDHEDGLLSYLQLYYCALADAKPLAFIILIIWLSLLFSTIGIAASDFLCINLSTLASILGLSESLTGVTFLAFGNGSPDVFSTFAAMRSNSGSLAIGELIGAASFITSVVAGSMALVRPFKVARRSFVRDVGYFVIAVSLSMLLLADGRLHVWESAAMVGLYVFYVVMVVTWHWYLIRRRRKNERDIAARSHFHIPENQELEVEEAMEDDDPAVASESRSHLRGASTEDFDLLERAEGIPAWKEEDEDDETRNRYLAEIRDNMHVYRPPTRSRRNTLNPIRPSLVGALEFQSVLHSLKKSRNIRRNPAISWGAYSDDDETSSQPFDTRSVASHPRISRPSAANDRLSPFSAGGSSRVRAVSANDADGLKLDTNVLDSQREQTPRLTLSRSSIDAPHDHAGAQPPQFPRIDTGAIITVSPSSDEHGSPGPSQKDQTTDLLAPPAPFHSPNYQTAATQDRSPQPVSPRGTTDWQQSAADPESPAAPFPSYSDISPVPSSRPPSIRLPTTMSPTERLHIHDIFDDFHGHFSLQTSLKWWPNSILPPPGQIGCTLFPTLAGWKSKDVWARLLGLVAAPSVLLLTITIPVIEPQAPESVELDPLPSVMIEQISDGDSPAPRVRLPVDSPVLRPLDSIQPESASEIPPADPHKSPHEEHPGRPRWDSELPAAPQPPASSEPPMPTKDWNRWLVSIQLFTGPFFIVLIAWTVMDEARQPRNFLLPSLFSLLFSVLCIIALIASTSRRPWHRRANADRSVPSEVLTTQSLPSQWRPFLSLLGFLVAISWIATIATEVVSLLKTLGVILDISDSLLGLTVFAVGNSLGDLVADITVARLGYPVMALSACFGGPMLNILLGIGLGGLYMTLNGGNRQRRDEALAAGAAAITRASYEISISKVLVISGATLLVVLVGLLIVVPMNGWRMDRKIGWGLVVVWCVSTLGNVIAELTL